MTLITHGVYEPQVKQKITPESVVCMIKEVRKDIAEVDSSFQYFSLKKVLSTIDSGRYENKKPNLMNIDLSKAKSIIESYRKSSEGGCKSCLNCGQETSIDEATYSWFCKVDDPEYNPNHAYGSSGTRYSGFTMKIKDNYDKPCIHWKPKISKTLKEIIDSEEN